MSHSIETRGLSVKLTQSKRFLFFILIEGGRFMIKKRWPAVNILYYFAGYMGIMSTL